MSIFAETSCSVPGQTRRPSVFRFQLSPKIEDDIASASKVFTTFVDLSVSGNCDLTCYLDNCHLLSISSILIHFWWGCLWLSGRIRLLLEGFWLTWGSRQCRIIAEPFWRDFRRWLHYLSPLDAKRNLHKSASFSPRKRVVCTRKLQSFALVLLAREIVDIGCRVLGQLLEETSLLCRLLKLLVFSEAKKFPLRRCNMSCPDRSLLLRATPR